MTQFIGRKLMAMPAAVLVFAIPKMALACAMCGLPLGDHSTHAYNTSVLFMMAVPYSICAIGAVVAFFAYRNANKRRLTMEMEDDHSQPVLDR